MKRAIKALLQLPPFVQIRRMRYEHTFRTIREGHLFRGVFDTFAEAAQSAPDRAPTGYDNRDAAAMYADRPIFSEDYAVLFWLQTLLRSRSRVFDFGGHAGSAFDAWTGVMPLPEAVDWTIYDVPEVTREGERRNERRTGARPRFTTDFDRASGVDVLLASGSLQYVEEPLANRLAKLPKKPRHLLFNQLPLHPDRSFVTLQNIRTCYCPYAIFHSERFFDSFRRLGYRVLHVWDNPAKSCWIATYPQHTAAPYKGALLRLEPPASV